MLGRAVAGVPRHRGAHPNVGPGPVPITKLLQVATATWLDAATSTPALPDDAAVRAVPEEWSRVFKMLFYLRWVATDDGEPPALLSSGLNSAKRITALARFRMGLHELQIERGHYERKPRSQRACQRIRRT
jgi:hypothetical protein